MSAADHQRVRLALPYLLALGWTIDVVAVHPDDVRSACDAFLEETVPAGVRIHRVRGLSTLWANVPGLGTLGYRCASAIHACIAGLLKQSGPANCVIYFSTTQFPVHRIIPALKAKFGVRVVVDYQDLWVNDYYAKNPSVVPPGGRLKYTLARCLDVHYERKTLAEVDAFTSVSPDYPQTLRARYPFIATKPFLVIPFGADERDFMAVRAANISQTRFQPDDGLHHWVYVGRGGPDMARALRGFFAAFHRAREIDPKLRKVRMHFLGTDYAPGSAARQSILPLAVTAGVADQVQETPQRLPYSETLRCLLDAAALIVPGSDDPAYTASKIYPYILARKPLLAIFHESSSVVSVLRETRAGSCVTFSNFSTDAALADEITRHWFAARQYAVSPAADWQAFAPYSASTMAGRLSELLASVATEPSLPDHGTN
ncbi:MAG: hypothetical protein KA257_04690 [Opitutaceae bacterium]|nr:hypothetical protein [Opitutaceae bacterium]MBP9911798.1 hypothetical protein [Opitutaceae bacterium]